MIKFSLGPKQQNFSVNYLMIQVDLPSVKR